MTAVAPLSDDEKTRIRYHLGYVGITDPTALLAGLPVSSQTLYVLERNLNNVMPYALPHVRRLLGILDATETRLVEAQERLSVASVDEVELRGITEGATETDALEREVFRFATRLADLLGARVNPESSRFSRFLRSGGGGVNVRIVRR